MSWHRLSAAELVDAALVEVRWLIEDYAALEDSTPALLATLRGIATKLEEVSRRPI